LRALTTSVSLGAPGIPYRDDDQATIAQFRQRHEDAIADLFSSVLGLVRAGRDGRGRSDRDRRRYERLDTTMGEIEEILDEAAIGWDRWVQEEVDRRRGK
jgi:hypothetical protein